MTEGQMCSRRYASLKHQTGYKVHSINACVKSFCPKALSTLVISAAPNLASAATARHRPAFVAAPRMMTRASGKPALKNSPPATIKSPCRQVDSGWGLKRSNLGYNDGTVGNFVRERRFDIQAAARVKRSPKSTAN
jgi:hypothetical protein